MAQSKKVTISTFSLLDLPDAALSIIIASLPDANKKMVMAACKKTLDMTMLNAEITVKVTKDSNFAGFKKVLNSTTPASIHLEITCPEKLNAPYLLPLSTVAILMDMVPAINFTQLATTCQGKAWDRIIKVTIKGTMLRCLLPRPIALACPKLEHLSVMKPSDAVEGLHIFDTKLGDALPMARCSSLKKLEIDESRPNFLPTRHSPAELRDILPNIDTLVFTRCYNASLIKAFATQLTRLEIHWSSVEDSTYALQHFIRPCYNIQHLCVPKVVLPKSTANLKFLELSYDVTDKYMQQLLQVSSLTQLHLPHLHNIQQDWSHHACPWQELRIRDSLHFATLAKLNLSSLKKLSVGPDAVLWLPAPAEPNSLSAVQQVVAGLSHVGQIVVNEKKTKAGVHFGRSGTIRWQVPYNGIEHEEKAAEFIRVAAQRVGTCRVCDCQELLGRPLLLDAVMQWGQTFIESLCLGSKYDLQPHVWQALHQLDRLHTLVFWGFAPPWCNSQRIDHSKEMLRISNAVYAAAQQYVIPTGRSLRVECGFSGNSLEPAALTQTKTFLHEAIQDVLPPGCKLGSVEFFSVKENELQSGCRHGCPSRAFWVVILDPLHPIA